MRFYWLKDRQEQGQFHIYWAPGEENFADYTTKHHSGPHHRRTRPLWVYIEEQSPRTIQGCIEILKPDKQTDRDSLAVTGTSMAARALAPQPVALSISLNCKPVSHDWYSKQATGYLPSISGLANRVLHTLLKRSFTYPLKRGKQALNLSLSYLV